MTNSQKRFTHAATTPFAVGYGYSDNEAIRALVFHGQTTFKCCDVDLHRIDAETGDLDRIDMPRHEVLDLIAEVAEQMTSEVKTLRGES